MSRIDELIARLCPDGVEYKALGDVCLLKRGKTITQKTAEAGDVPVVAGGQKPAYYVASFNHEGEVVTVAGSGAYAGFVLYWNEPIWIGDAFSIEPFDLGNLSCRYVFHWLKNMQPKIHGMKKGSGVPHVKPADLAPMKIPVPPMEVQREIVRVLDSFAELEAELEARRQQYAYYRDKLLDFTERESPFPG